jgi:type VI secretion system secreted protein Hcp
MNLPRRILAVSAVAVFFFALSAFASFNTYLKIDGIKGDVTESGHEGWIELNSFSLGTPQTVATGSGAMHTGTNRATFRARTGMWTPQIMQAVATGKHFPQVTIDFGPTEYVFHNVIFSSASAGGGGGAGLPEESLSLNYTSVEIKYTQQPGRTAEPPKPAIAASMVNPSVRSVPLNAQVFVDGVPSDRFTLVSFNRLAPTTAVIQIRNAPANGFFAADKKKNSKVNVKANSGQFLEMQMTDCTISSYSLNADGTATATLNFAEYTGPVTVRP